MRFEDNVRFEQAANDQGRGCVSTISVLDGGMLGIEKPVVCAVAYYSRKMVASCAWCFRHYLPFRRLVKAISHVSETSSRSDQHLNNGWFWCEHCDILICDTCAASEHLSIHELVCPRGNPERGALLRDLEKLSVRVTESFWLALLYMARLLVRGGRESQVKDVKLPEYFSSHDLVPTIEWYETHAIAQQLFGLEIKFVFWKRIVETFEQTNLYLEIENATMMEDIAAGALDDVTSNLLRRAYETHGFPAIIDEGADAIPLPVVVGSGHYPTVALMNHSCYPNVEWQSVNGTNTIGMVALRNIEPGDELCVSYIDQSLPRLERRAELMRLYKFNCTCSKCLAGE